MLIIGGFVPALLMCLVIYATPPIWGMFCLLFLVGVFLSPYVLNFAIADALAPASSRSTCIGLTNGLGMLSAPIFQIVVGKLLDIHHIGSETTIVGQYQLSDYHFALFFFPIILSLAGVIAFFIKFQGLSRPSHQSTV